MFHVEFFFVIKESNEIKHLVKYYTSRVYSFNISASDKINEIVFRAFKEIWDEFVFSSFFF